MKHILCLFAVLLIAIPLTAGAVSVAPVNVLFIKDQIDPAVADYVKDGIRNAETEEAQAVLIVMDTPGGAMNSMQSIIQTFFASKVPVIVYVAPNGATAGSAGTFITMAADIAAMAPVSNIGSASPVTMDPSSGESKEIPKTMKKKVENFAAEYARSIAEKRGRNKEWAVLAVREAANLTSTEALKKNVIDYVARSNRDLMKKIDGKQVKLTSGKTVTLFTANAPLKEYPMGAWDSFLHLLSSPLVAMFLFMAAMYGIIYELSNPGAILPGVIGGIALIMLLYSFSVIPINAAGLALVALAIIFFVVDLHIGGSGFLTAGGIISLFLGLMMLFRASEGFMVSYWTIGAVTLLTAAFFVFVIGLGLRAQKNPYIAGREGVVGHYGEARTELNPTGSIFVSGAIWSATSLEGPISAGETVEVVEMKGLRLTVRRHEG